MPETACVVCGTACRPADRFCSQCGRPNPTEGDSAEKVSQMASLVDLETLYPETGARRGPRADSPFAVGSLFAGRYRIQRLLGKGGMGRVFAANDESIDEMVALKVLSEQFSGDKEILDQFKRELKLARRVRQRNVVQSFDLGFSGDLCYISMEFIDADNLATYQRRKGTLPEHDALRILVQVLKGLRAAHELGIVHRDIKSGNILLNKERIAFITDFGLATPSAIVPQLFAGTPDYMAPEQFRGEAVVDATDLYACGILLYAMLTGRLPFQGSTYDELMAAHLFVRPRRIPDGVASPTTRELIADLLRKEPTERPQKAAAVIERVNAILAETTLTVQTKRPIALLVESEPDVLKLCAEILEREGYFVLTAVSAHEGVSLAFENDLAVIILDAAISGGLDLALQADPAMADLNPDLPGLEGLGFCRILQMDGKLREVPILVTSAQEQPGLRVAFGLMGAAGVMTKPISAEELSRAVYTARKAALGEDD